ncbi:hypothetical protein [Mesorhizobium sp. KR2-14]|uniref:hypothetical protein n=1 Tax=Mesorhizobium sp. KR2-14 TaxID=3156610 RepID=UPI0032B54A37
MKPVIPDLAGGRSERRVSRMTNAIALAHIFIVGDLRRAQMKPVIPDLASGRSERRVSRMTNAIALAPIFNVGDLRKRYMKSSFQTS